MSLTKALHLKTLLGLLKEWDRAITREEKQHFLKIQGWTDEEYRLWFKKTRSTILAHIAIAAADYTRSFDPNKNHADPST